MGHCLSPDDLRALAAGTLPTEAQTLHLGQCPACRRAVRDALEQLTLPASASDSDRGGERPTLDAVPVEQAGRYQRLVDADGRPKVLGRGGIGRVELVRDQAVGRDVAVKVLRSRQLEAPRRAVAEARLLQEARIVGQLEHPAIVPLYEVARSADGQLYYAMRRIRGRTLSDAARAAGTLDERLRLLPHVLAACNAIAYAHSRGVVHRDLKPQNVMVDRFGETLVIDWGLARARMTPEPAQATAPDASGALRLVSDDATLGDGAGRIGTPAYMSPEQLTGLRDLLDEKSDVWGLGAMLYEVLTARAPREKGALAATVRSPRELVPELPEDLAAICDRAIAESREARYGSAEALAKDLDAWLHGRRVTAHTYRPRELIARFVRANRATVAVAMGALLLLAALGVSAAVRVRAERDEARGFALLIAGDVLQRIPFDGLAGFRAELTARVSAWLLQSSEQVDAHGAARAWEQLSVAMEREGRFAEAAQAATRCAAAMTKSRAASSPELAATRLSCEAAAIDFDEEQTLDARRERLDALWRARPRDLADSKELVAAYAGLAKRLTWFAARAEATYDATLERESLALAVRRTELEPTSADAWRMLTNLYYYRVYAALNAVDVRRALDETTRMLDAARRYHELEASGDSLLRLAEVHGTANHVYQYVPEIVPDEQVAAVERESRRLLDGLFALGPGVPRYRRAAANVLLEQGDLAEAWRLVDGLPLDVDPGLMVYEFYVAVLAGHPDRVLVDARPSLEALDNFDAHLLLGLALEQRHRYREAGAQLRLAASREISTFWPLETMRRWSSTQSGPSAPALAVFGETGSRAVLLSDEGALKTCVEVLATALEALEP